MINKPLIMGRGVTGLVIHRACPDSSQRNVDLTWLYSIRPRHLFLLKLDGVILKFLIPYWTTSFDSFGMDFAIYLDQNLYHFVCFYHCLHCLSFSMSGSGFFQSNTLLNLTCSGCYALDPAWGPCAGRFSGDVALCHLGVVNLLLCSSCYEGILSPMFDLIKAYGPMSMCLKVSFSNVGCWLV